MSKHLEDYLRAYRKRAGLSQNDVAVLVGFSSATSVSRLERRKRTLGLDIAIAYMIVFGEPLEDLVPGRVHETDTAVRERAQRLLAQLDGAGHDARIQQRVLFLRRLLGRESLGAHPIYEQHQGGEPSAGLFL